MSQEDVIGKFLRESAVIGTKIHQDSINAKNIFDMLNPGLTDR
ncbi:MAG: hypothetical protein Q8O89_05175 [Nanoarchaeota archaeon]|nr:hypothetical protein [Nanoarchaeota archaeon]